MGDTPYHQSEYFVYMMKGSKRLKVLLEGYHPVMVDFTMYGVKEGVEGLKTYSLVLNLSIPQDLMDHSVMLYLDRLSFDESDVDTLNAGAYALAALEGNAFAQYALGRCYYEGKGVPKNYAKAMSWFRKSASQGSSRGIHGIGRCFRDGNGVEQNINGLAQFYELADHENVVLSGIPAGATIKFTEVGVVDFTTTATFNGVENPVTVGKTEDQDNGERTFSITVPEAVPEGKETHEVTVNNHKHTNPPPTGIGLESTAFIMLMCMAMLGMALLALRRLAASRAAVAQGHERKRTFTGTR